MHCNTTDHPTRAKALRPIGVLMMVTMMVAACGGGGDAEAPPAAAAGTPAPAVSNAKLVDLALCPAASLGRSTDWYKTCLVNKRLVGKTPDNSRFPDLPQLPVLPCAVTLRPDGVFDFIKNDAVIMATPPVSLWFETTGSYGNTAGANGQRTFSATLSGLSDPSPNNPRQSYNLSIQVVLAPDLSPVLSTLSVSLTVSGLGAGVETCELPFNLGQSS
jgi:hypothetical protein